MAMEDSSRGFFPETKHLSLCPFVNRICDVLSRQAMGCVHLCKPPCHFGTGTPKWPLEFEVAATLRATRLDRLSVTRTWSGESESRPHWHSQLLNPESHAVPLPIPESPLPEVKVKCIPTAVSRRALDTVCTPCIAQGWDGRERSRRRMVASSR